jgi:putative aminopeptidase FrvX
MLWMNEYPEEVKALVAEVAERAGVHLRRGLRFRNATDGLVALQHRIPAAMIGSVDEFKMPTDYHWPTDTADRVDYRSVAAAARLCRALVDRLTGRSPVAAAPSEPASSPG